MLHCPRNFTRTLMVLRNRFYSRLRNGSRSRSDRRLESRGRSRQHPRRRMQRQHVGRGGVGENTRRPRQQQSRCLAAEPTDPGHADPARHEEKDRARTNGKAKSTTPRTASSIVRRSSPSVQISSRFRAASWAFCAAARPGPASHLRFRAALPTAWPRDRRRPPVESRPPACPVNRLNRKPLRLRPRPRRPDRPVRKLALPAKRPRPPQVMSSAIFVSSLTSRGLPISAG